MKRVTILGGGPAALAAAWQLSEPALRGRFQVDVYTMGHRLGGKTASGRDEHGRILEHGLHILFGFYENFFRMVRQAYAELDRPPDHPMATWRHAFHPAGPGALCDGDTPIVFQYPGNGSTPGDGGPRSVRELALGGVLAALEIARGWEATQDRLAPMDGEAWRALPSSLPAVPGVRRGLMRAALALGRGIRVERPLRILRELGGLRSALMRRLDTLPLEWRGGACLIDLWATLALGLLEDDVRDAADLARLDSEDWAAWLARHGADPVALASPYARTVYDAAFSFADGDPSRPSIGAGSALLGQLMGSFTYKGACFYKMQTGMGDAVLAPLYLALQNRGVRFHFFHRARAVRVDGQQVTSIELDEQVHAPNYQPLIEVLGLPCWPEEPDWKQLPEAARGRRMESWWDAGGRAVTLHAGRDFDHVVYALPIGTVAEVCQDLVRADPRWARMDERVQSITTIAVQLWSDRTLPELGWHEGEPLLSCFRPPLPTWADMSQVLPTEAWEGPRHVSYFCGTQDGPTRPPRPSEDPDFPRRENDRFRADVPRTLRDDWGLLLPGLLDADGELDFARISDPLDRRGADRLDALHIVANCEPHSRCTVALPGTTEARIAPDASGWSNLALAGDWTANGIHMACVEGAVISGVLAARAVSGEAHPVLGPVGHA